MTSRGQARGDAESLPEIDERDAQGEVALLYERLRVALPARTVNLVYRRLATIPGALAWSVTVAEALAVDGALERLAAELSATPVPAVPPIPSSTWLRHGVPSDELRRADTILTVYNWSNPRNLLVVHAMDWALRRTAGGSGRSHRRAPAPPPVAHPAGAPGQLALEPPVPADRLAPDVLVLAREMCRRLGVDGRLLPTLHRHLGAMPDVYRVLADSTREIVADGRVTASAEHWQETAADLVGSTAARAGAGDLPETSWDDVLAVIGSFQRVIPLHSVLGIVWQRSLADALRTEPEIDDA